MHQIRVHLQFLGKTCPITRSPLTTQCPVGHPIVNDPLYNHPAWKHRPAEGQRVGGATEEGACGCSGSRCDIEQVVTEIIWSKFTEPLLPASSPSTEGERDRGGEERGKEGEEGEGKVREMDGGGKGKMEGELGKTLDKELKTPTTRMKVCQEEQALPSASDTSYDPDCSECRLIRPHPQLSMYLHALSYRVSTCSNLTRAHCFLPPSLSVCGVCVCVCVCVCGDG